jgi:hypothetical protein
VEELLLGLDLPLEELDVVDQQDVDVPVTPLERARLVVADAVDEVVGELLGVHVPHLHTRVEVLRVVADGVEQVRLAQPGLPVDEEWVVGLRGRLGDGDRGRVGEPVARADDERLERVLRVEPRGLRGRACGCLADRRGQAAGRGGRCRDLAGAGARVPQRRRPVDETGGAGALVGPDVDDLVGGRGGRLGDLAGRRHGRVGGAGGRCRLRGRGPGGGRCGLGGRGGRRLAVGVAGRAAGCHRGGLAGEAGVHGDGEADGVAELLGQQVGDRLAHALLEDLLGEVVRRGEERRPVEQAHRADQPDERPLGRRDRVVERLEDARPDRREPLVRRRHGRSPPASGGGPHGCPQLCTADVCAFTQRRHFPRIRIANGDARTPEARSVAGLDLSVVRRVARADEM